MSSTPALQDKRLAVTAATIALVTLGKKIGIEFTPAELVFLGSLVTGYIAQSQIGAVKKAQAEGKKAAAKVQTSADSVKVLGAADQ